VKIADAVRRTVDRQHAGDVRGFVTDFGETADARGIGDERLGSGILQTVGQRVRPEQYRDRQRHRPQLVDRDVTGRDFRRLRQVHRDAIAPRNAIGTQHIGETIRCFAQPAE